MDGTEKYWRLPRSIADRVEKYGLYSFCQNNEGGYDRLGLFPSGENDGWTGCYWVRGQPCYYSRGNCWRYVCNDPAKAGERPKVNPPGQIVGPLRPDVYKYTCDSIKKGMLEKYKGSVAVVGQGGDCDNCHYKVLLAIRPNPVFVGITSGFKPIILPPDYHWYRQDTDDQCKPTGTWSHKPGMTPVQTGVMDPAVDAESRHYKSCQFYFCFPCAKKGQPSLDAD